MTDECKTNGCDGGGTEQIGLLRVLPTGGDSNLILCYRCYLREIEYRIDRNKELGDFAKYDLPAWKDLTTYDAS